MRKTVPLVVGVVFVLAACGGDDEASSAPPKESLKQAVDVSTSEEENTPAPIAVTPEQRRVRAAVALLKNKLSRATDPEDKADLLAEVAQLGAGATALWPVIQTCARDEEPYLRSVALETAAQVMPGSCQALLQQALEDDEMEVREKAASAWSRAGIKELSPLLEHLEEEFEGRVQFAIMVAVEALAEKHHMPLIRNVVEDLDTSALRPVVRLITKHGEPADALLMTGFLDRDDVDLRIQTSRSLKALKNQSKPVLRALANTLLDDEQTVREAAVDALKSLADNEFGFEPDADEEVRSNVRKAWIEWIERKK